MSEETSWAAEAPAINHNARVEIENTTSVNTAVDNSDFYSGGLFRIIGNSAALQRVLRLVRLVAPTGATVLIQGETGTGKELIAEAIHKCSDRSSGPFVKVSCAAIPSGLLESELFGHERGAYTGAFTRSIGRFERANSGTLFLDEIGDLPLELQPKLLRVMQEGQFERLGGAATVHTDVRVICATHRNLTEMIEERLFRADLFYRLGAFPIELPPLRERPDDIGLLARHFAMNYAQRMNKPITTISEEFVEALAGHSWPGNVRELQNFIERSVIRSTGSVLNGSLPEFRRKTHDGSKWPEVSASVTLEEAARWHILQTLLQTRGVVGGHNGAAARLGLPRTTLIAKMTRLGINPGQRSSVPVRAAAPVREPDSRCGSGAGTRGTCKGRADRRSGTDMPEAQATKTPESPSDPSFVNEDRTQGWGSDDTKVDAARMIAPYQRSEASRETISTIGWLSTSVLHDLRNPLGTICAGTELLMDLDSTSTQVKRLAGNICRAAGRIRQLLADLASVARPNISTAEFCDIREVIAAASEAALATMEQQSIEILLDVPDGIGLPLVRSHIERVFFNLIANAFEAMAGCGTVRIGARKAGTSVLIELEDTGPGIPACISDRLFEPLSTSGKKDGLGIGLALARQTVRNHGGDMWTEPAAGARFVIRLPLDRPNYVPGRAAFSENVSAAIRWTAPT
jgi:DNA-binding NtrC family response regulator